MKKYVIKLNSKVYEVEMEEVTAEESSALANKSSETKSSESISSNANAAPKSVPSNGGEVVEAPMPGTILSISVKLGDVVKKGDILLVLEAMKMENEIVSPTDGTVSYVGVTNGQAVNPGEVLVKIA